MLVFAPTRFGSALLVMFAISVLVFLIFFATPGVDPAARIAGRNADPATLAQVRHSFGLDRPMPVRYLLMMRHLLIDRDLESFVNRGSRVIPQILQATPVTLSLVVGRSQPGSAQRWPRPRLGPARGGTHSSDGRRMRGLPVGTWSGALRSIRRG